MRCSAPGFPSVTVPGMDFTPLSNATHVSASFYPNSDELPFPEINVICRLEADTEIPELAVEYTGELFDVLCEAFDADVFGVSLPLPEAWAASEDRIGALMGSSCYRSSAATPSRAWPR